MNPYDYDHIVQTFADDFGGFFWMMLEASLRVTLKMMISSFHLIKSPFNEV